MSNAYDTLINWLDSTGITGFFHGLSWSAIALIAICIALGLYIKFKKKKPKVNDLTDGKKNTTNFIYGCQVAIFLFISFVAGMACFNFGYERMGIEGGAIAVAVSLVLFGAYLRNSRKHNRTQTTIEYALLVPFMIFEVIVVGANFITVGENKPAAAVEQKRVSYNMEVARLIESIEHIPNPRSNTGIYDKRLINKAIKLEKEKLEDLPVFRNSEKKFYEQAALFLAIDIGIIELLFNISLGALLVIGGAITGTRINSYVCPYLIKQQMKLDAEIALLMNGVVIESGSDEGLEDKGTQKKARNGSNAVDEGYSAAKAWISDHSSGQVLSAKTMRSVMGTTSGNQTIIINRLKSNKLITQGKNGNRPQYKKAGIAVKAKVFSMFGKS